MWVLGEGGGLKSARIAVKRCGKGCVGEGFCHFLQQEGDEVFLCDDAGDDADKEEKGFPYGDTGAADVAEEGVEVAFAAEGCYAKQGEYGVNGGAYGGAMGDFFPFKVVGRGATMEDFTAAAPEQDTATVDFSEYHEEEDGGKKQVERFFCVGADTKEECEGEDGQLQVLDDAVFVSPGVRRKKDNKEGKRNHG